MAKYLASEFCSEVTQQSFRIHGGYGYSKEYEIERLMRDAPFLLIGEGTSEIQKLIIGRRCLRNTGSHAKEDRMGTETMEELLGSHPFFAGLSADVIRLVAGCASNADFAKASTSSARERRRAASMCSGTDGWRWRSIRRSGGRWSSRPWTREKCSAGRG